MKRRIFFKMYVDGNVTDGHYKTYSNINYIPQMIEKWKQSEQGQFVLAHSNNIEVYREFDFCKYQTVIAIVGSLPPKQDTFYSLKWPPQSL